MDTFELNKIAGAVLGTVLLVMGLGIVAERIYTPTTPTTPGYAVAVPEEGEAGEPAEVEDAVPLAVLLAEADVSGGEAQAKKCAACHTFEDGGANKVGPNLHGIVGRQIASASGFSYSDEMQAYAAEAGTWTYENLSAFIENPRGYIQGTNMAFAGIRRDEQRADLLLYLKDQSPDAPPLPVVEEVAAEAPAEGEAASESGAPEAATSAPAEDSAGDAPSSESDSGAMSPPAGETTAPASDSGSGSSNMAPADSEPMDAPAEPSSEPSSDEPEPMPDTGGTGTQSN